MSYLVFCTFDLKNASAKDYENAYADLKALGLTKVQKSDNGGDTVIPPRLLWVPSREVVPVLCAIASGRV